MVQFHSDRVIQPVQILLQPVFLACRPFTSGWSLKSRVSDFICCASGVRDIDHDDKRIFWWLQTQVAWSRNQLKHLRANRYEPRYHYGLLITVALSWWLDQSQDRPACACRLGFAVHYWESWLCVYTDWLVGWRDGLEIKTTIAHNLIWNTRRKTQRHSKLQIWRSFLRRAFSTDLWVCRLVPEQPRERANHSREHHVGWHSISLSRLRDWTCCLHWQTDTLVDELQGADVKNESAWPWSQHSKQNPIRVFDCDRGWNLLLKWVPRRLENVSLQDYSATVEYHSYIASGQPRFG